MIIPLRSTAAPSTPLTRLDRETRLRPGAAFGGSALSFAALYLAAGAPSPLLVVYQRQWGFAAWVLTIAFAAYAIGLLAALLVVGSVSDYLGRRPVLIAALLAELASMLFFVFAPGIGWVIVARTVQGIATGAATSAFTASIVELAPQRHKRLGTIVSGVAPAGGLGLGALLTGAAVQFTTDANLIVFTILAAVMAVGTLVVTFTSETITPRPGAGRTLIPRVAIPPLARREFDAAIPVHIAAWMLAALFIGLAPMIIRDIFGIDGGLLNGATVFVEPASAAAAGFLLGRITPRTTTVVGGASVMMGTAIIIGGVVAALLPLVWIGGIIGGVGFGASFSGALRTITPLAEPQQRAGMFAAVYLVAYLAFGIPAIVAGLLVAHIGLLDTVLAYSGATFIVATAGLLTQTHMRSTADYPRATARPG
jgi:MFS family permease